MASPSKEENVLKLILENSPFKKWHFKEIVKHSKVTKAVANKWLRKYEKKGLIKRVKQKGRFPYFIVGSKNMVYYSLKRLYALEQLYKSGLIQHLLLLENAKTIILFGSIIKGDYYKYSDIDIFIYGNADGFDKSFYESKLGKIMELHVFESREEINNIRTGIINNIINGYIVKGKIQDVVEVK